MQDEPKNMRQLIYDWDMRLMMNAEKLQTIEQVNQFLEVSEALEVRGLTTEVKYYWIEEVLIGFKYHRLKSEEKGIIRRYIEMITGYSRAQVSRLIGRYKETGGLKKTKYRRHRFPRMYTLSEVECWLEQMHYTIS